MPVYPIADWMICEPCESRLSADALATVRSLAASRQAAALMIIAGGKACFTFGDIAQKVQVGSIRKSLLSVLFGIGKSTNDLSQTLRRLSIDDRPHPLTDMEKGETVRDLLMARSGVFHAVAGLPRDSQLPLPPRGSRKPSEA